eukprot:EST46046.1 Transmembrane domain-containing protein [Spironucleus salmonicida]
MIIVLSISVIMLPQRYIRKITHIVTGFVFINYFVNPEQCPLISALYPGIGLFIYLICLIIPNFIFVPILLSKNNKPYPFEIITYFALVIAYPIFKCDHKFGMSLCALIGGDGLAGFSTYFKSKALPSNPQKTILGVFLTLFGTIICQWFYGDINIFSALVACLGESIPAISDNFTITLLTYLSFYSPYKVFIMTILIHISSFLMIKRKLTKNGAIISIFILAFHLYVSYKALLAFFGFGILGVIASQFRKQKRLQIEKTISTELKLGRSAWQAFDNSIASIICLIFYLITKNEKFITASVAASAECLTDTFGSDLGCVLSNRTYHPITFRQVKTGINGGISIEGTLSGFIGALIICMCVFVDYKGMREFWWIFFAAIIGSYSDSLIGMYLQYSGEYDNGVVTTPIDGSVSIGGINFFSNGAVNVVASFISALVIIIFY